MKTKLAVAMALVAAGFSVGLSTAPFAAAGHNNCHAHDFAIPDSEPLDINARDLDPGMSELGLEDVSAGTSEELTVELVEEGDNGEVNWTVYFENDQGECQKFTSGNCDIDGSYPNTIDTEGPSGQQSCDLDDPSSGVRDYFVLFEAGEQNAIEYKAWESS